MIDECARYLSNDIAEILVWTRKYGLHLILAHHYLQQLKDVGDLVYKGVLSGAQSKMIFGGLEPEDAQVLADYIDEYDFETPIPTLIKPTVVGARRTIFNQASAGRGSGAVIQAGSTTKSDLIAPDGSVSYGTAQVTPNGATVQTSHMTTRGWSEGLEPIFEDRPTQVFGPEQLRLMDARKLHRQPQRIATFMPPIGESQRFQFKKLPKDYACPEHVEKFKHEVRNACSFTVPEDIVKDERTRRRAKLANDVRDHLRLPVQRTQTIKVGDEQHMGEGDDDPGKDEFTERSKRRRKGEN